MTRQIEVIDELAARGADLNARRQDGARPIQLANGDYSYRGWRDVPDSVATTPREVLTHLRARGADVDICTAAYIGDRLLRSEDAEFGGHSEHLQDFVFRMSEVMDKVEFLEKMAQKHKSQSQRQKLSDLLRSNRFRDATSAW